MTWNVFVDFAIVHRNCPPPEGFLFMGGRMRKAEWIALWGRLAPGVADSLDLIEGPGAALLRRWPVDNRVRVVFTARSHIGQQIFPMEGEEPAVIRRFI